MMLQATSMRLILKTQLRGSWFAIAINHGSDLVCRAVSLVAAIPVIPSARARAPCRARNKRKDEDHGLGGVLLLECDYYVAMDKHIFHMSILYVSTTTVRYVVRSS